MGKNYTLPGKCGVIAAALFCTSFAATALADGVKEIKVAAVETYGDYMTGADDLQSKIISFYGKDNRLLYKATYAADGQLVKLATYIYDDKGQLVESYSQLSQENIAGFTEMGDKSEEVTYEYNDKGQLVKERGDNSYNYEYDADGNLVKKELLVADWETNELTVNQTITYSDFVAKDCPTKVESTGIYDDYIYTGEITYNADNKVLSEINYTENDNAKTVKNSTKYTYDDNGDLKEKATEQSQAIFDSNWNITGYELVPTAKLIYSADGDNRVKEETWTYNSYASTDDEKWIKSVTFVVTESREFDDATSAGIKVEYDETAKFKKNNVIVTADLDEAQKEGYVYDVYRDCVKVGTIDPKSGTSFSDKELRNGNHVYFLQAVANDEKALAFNVSELKEIESDTELPAPKNVRAEYKETQTEVTDWGSFDNVNMIVNWDAPEGIDELGLEGYNVYSESSYGGDLAENSDNPNLKDTQYKVMIFPDYNTDITIFVQAVYKYGVANSDRVKIDFADLKDITDGIAAATANGTVSYTGGVVNVSEPATISVIDLSGKKMGEAVNATSLSLDGMPAGVYIVSVQQNGKCSVMKLRK